jgi:hypothetical protein
MHVLRFSTANHWNFALAFVSPRFGLSSGDLECCERSVLVRLDLDAGTCPDYQVVRLHGSLTWQGDNRLRETYLKTS